jgi:hypothetical protein
MSAKAICPNCNVANDPSNVTCEVCKTALGALLVEEVGGAKYFGLSVLLSLAICFVLWMLGFRPIALVVSVFYATLLTSYFARTNVVWASALGGLAAGAIVIVLAIGFGWGASKGTFAALLDEPPITDGTKSDARSSQAKLGALAASLFIFPVSLIGASVGEHLALRRRRRARTG